MKLLLKLWIATGRLFAVSASALAGQAPGPASAPDVVISHADRFYTADQFSNTVSVIDPADNKLLGVIKLGDQTPMNLSPLYRGQLLVHGMGFSPDHKTLVVVSIGSNSVTFIETATNVVKRVAYVGRSPHEAFFTPDGKEVWVSIRGEDYIAVLDAQTAKETARINVPNGPGMTIFSPDGQYGYVCSSFSPETVVIDTKSREIVGRVQQESPFCPDIAATPDGKQVWLTLKDVGRTMVFDARPPFTILKSIETGPITNHVNFARTKAGQFAYVTVGGLNQVKVFRTEDFTQVATVPTGALPHGLWPSGDGSRIYVGLENADEAAVIDTGSNTVAATIPLGQGPQGVTYVPNAAPAASGSAANLQPFGAAARTEVLTLNDREGRSKTEITLFDQGLLQVLQAVVTGLPPKKPFVLALSNDRNGKTAREPLAAFMTNPAGAAIVNAIGPIRQITKADHNELRRYLLIVNGKPGELGEPVQFQASP
jgi:YVTN family beta-propeller protein